MPAAGHDSLGVRRELKVGDASYDVLLARGGRRAARRHRAACPIRSRSCSRTCCATRTAAASPPTTSRRWSPGRGAPLRSGDRLPPGARADAGLHRRAGGGRPRGDAPGDGRARRRPAQINPLSPVDLVIDHSVQVDAFGNPQRVPDQRRARVRAQRRALRLPALGRPGVRQLPRGAAGHRHLPPGQPRVPGAGGLDRQGRQPPARLPRHAGRHRQPHHDDQRPGRARLGRGRHRGRGGDARPADLDADPRGGRLQAHRPAAGGRDRDRPRADRDRDAAQEGRGRQVRRVLRRRPRPSAARRPRDHRQHGAGVRRHLRLLPGRPADPRLPAPHRPPPERIALVEAYAKAQGLWRDDRRRPTRCSATPSSSTSATVEPSLAGPKRPQDRVALSRAKAAFEDALPRDARPRAPKPDAKRAASPAWRTS